MLKKYQDAVDSLPMERLFAFVPRELLGQLSDSDGGEVKASYREHQAAMLYVDVTGFSKIANQLHSFTNEGAEVLSSHLNAYFTQIISAISKHSGDVLLFSGDALLVSWSCGSAGPDDPFTRSQVSACAECGWALQRDCKEYRFSVETAESDEQSRTPLSPSPRHPTYASEQSPTPPAVVSPQAGGAGAGGSRTLSLEMNLHIGSAYGPAVGCVVGGASVASLGLWKYVVIGEAVELAGVGSNLGVKGDFYMHEAFARLLGPLPPSEDAVRQEVCDAEHAFYQASSVARAAGKRMSMLGRRPSWEHPFGVPEDATDSSGEPATRAGGDVIDDAGIVFIQGEGQRKSLVSCASSARQSAGVGGGRSLPRLSISVSREDELFTKCCSESSPLKGLVEGMPYVTKANVSCFTFDTLIYSEINAFLRSQRAGNCIVSPTEVVSSQNAAGSSSSLRTVSTMFIKLCGVKHGQSAEKAHTQLHKAVRVLQKSLLKVDGILNKIIMDDKGILCVCVFGLPHHAHEDDALRSVMFSQKILKKLTKEVGSTLIGICRAKVFCGTTGAPERKEYTVLGDGVNLAARLMSKCEADLLALSKEARQKATTQVICDWDTVQEVVRLSTGSLSVAFVDAGDLTLKGREHPIGCFFIVPQADKERLAKELRSAAGVADGESDNSQHNSGGSGSGNNGTNSGGSGQLSCRSAPSRSSSRSTAKSVGSISSFGSLFSLPRHGVPGAVTGKRHRAGKGGGAAAGGRFESMTPTHSVSSASILSGGSGAGSSVAVGPRGVETIEGKREEVATVVGFCDAWGRTQRHHRDTSKRVRARPHAELAAGGSAVLCISGLMQTGKTKFLARAQEVLELRQLDAILLSCGEANAHAQYEALRPVVHRALSLCDPDDLTELDLEDLPLVSYVCRDDRVPLPLDADALLSTPEKLERLNNVLEVLLACKVGWPLMFLVDDIRHLDYASLTFVMHALHRGCGLIYTERLRVAPRGETRVEGRNEGAAAAAAAAATAAAALDGAAARRASLASGRQSTEVTAEASCHSSLSTLSEGAALAGLLSGVHADLSVCDDECDALLERLQTLPDAEKVTLAPMTRREHDALLTAVAAHDVDPVLVERLYKKSGGVPGYSLQMLEFLGEAGFLSVRNSQVVLMKKNALNENMSHCVRGIEASVMRVADSLPDRAQTALQACAVLQHEGPFPRKLCLDLIATLHEGPPADILAELLASDLVLECGRSSSATASPQQPPTASSPSAAKRGRSLGMRSPEARRRESADYNPRVSLLELGEGECAAPPQPPPLPPPQPGSPPSSSGGRPRGPSSQQGLERAYLSFSQQLVRDAVYTATLRSTRREYHRIVAGLVEELDEASRCDGTYAEMLCHHRRLTGDPVPFKTSYGAFLSAAQRGALEEARGHLERLCDAPGSLSPYEEAMLMFNRLALVNELGRDEDFIEPGAALLHRFMCVDEPPEHARRAGAGGRQQRAGLLARLCGCCVGGGAGGDFDDAGCDDPTEMYRRDSPDGQGHRYAPGEEDMYVSMSHSILRKLEEREDAAADTAASPLPAARLPDRASAKAAAELQTLYSALLCELRFARGDLARMEEAALAVEEGCRRLARLGVRARGGGGGKSLTQKRRAAGGQLAFADPARGEAFHRSVSFFTLEDVRSDMVSEARDGAGGALSFADPFAAMSAFRFPDVLKKYAARAGELLVNTARESLAAMPSPARADGEPLLLVLQGRCRMSAFSVCKSCQAVCCILQGDRGTLRHAIGTLRASGSPKWALSSLHLAIVARQFVDLDGTAPRGMVPLVHRKVATSVGGGDNNATSQHRDKLMRFESEKEHEVLKGSGFGDLVAEALHTASAKVLVNVDVALETLDRLADVPTPYCALAALSVTDRIVGGMFGTELPVITIGGAKSSSESLRGNYKTAMRVLRKAAAPFPVFEPCIALYDGLAKWLTNKRSGVCLLTKCVDLTDTYGMPCSVFAWRARAALLLASEPTESSIAALMSNYAQWNVHAPYEYALLEQADANTRHPSCS